MTKTITITDPRQVKAGDKAYFKDCDFGFTVSGTSASDADQPIAVCNPLSGLSYWASLSQFDHATREVEEPEWPEPHDIKLHIYLGADGRRYIYNPISEYDSSPWACEGNYVCHSSENMESYCRDALPLTELELVPKKRES
jgi:hypothetical protein